MQKFPEDVRLAETKTGGDANIIDKEEFQPEKKPNIASIFGDQTPKLKKLTGLGRGRRKAPSIEDLTYSRAKVRIINTIFSIENAKFIEIIPLFFRIYH